MSLLKCLIIIIFSLYIIKNMLLNVPKVPKFDFKLTNKGEPNYNPKMIYQLLSPEECKQIIKLANTVGYSDSKLSSGKLDTNYRLSKTVWLCPVKHPIVNKIYDRVKEVPELKGHDYTFEKLQVVKYNTNGFYKKHYDQPHRREVVERTNLVRKWTILIYLNDDYEGGNTEFPRLKLSIKGKKGDGLMFHSLSMDNRRVNRLSLHTGTPIQKGEKIIANVWVRKNIL